MLITALFLLSLLWGSTFYFTKLLLPDFHPVSIVFYRCLFGMMALLPFFLWKKSKKDFQRVPALLLITLISAGIPWVFMSLSLRGLDTTISGVLNASGPIFGIVLSVLIFRTPVTRQELWSVLVGFGGICTTLIAGMNGSDPFHFGPAGLLLVAVCFYSMSAVLSANNLKHCSLITLSFMTMLAGTIYSGIFMMFVEPKSFQHFNDLKPFLLFIVLGMVISGFGNVLYYYLVKSGGALFALLVTYLMPIMTILLGVLFLEEKVNGGILSGLLFVFTSVYLMNKKIFKEMGSE
ncbi:DMT family transporter [Peribacillus simplex]|uniref:DMT family transporter n=1 Tax=Peribacillus simplex TaxID=1478 RepID=A0A9X8ZEM6_9BACI|nr:DMT family transporter [Peribacillus simplex]TKH08710.1 DMT family transporter [Peribacillus simplex]